MKLLRKIKDWWASTEPVPETYDYVPSTKDFRAESVSDFKKRKSEIDHFLAEAFGFLPLESLQKLQRRVLREMKAESGGSDNSCQALTDGLRGDFSSKRRIPYMLAFDARYAEDVASSVNTLLQAYGIFGEFVYDEAQQSHAPIAALKVIQAWLRERDFDLISFDSGNDEYCCFIVLASKAGVVVRSGQALGMRMSNEMSEI